ncbi:hypothetical protein An08g06485 [Aspergillus niger]|uniref:Uncharacterized protein n=2 Tax=Aspergillus niger TaxID=5061 RepID=A2QRL7_ASPNC|nr:hypothetical protein An08g06485 [Aspergillus niger]CAK45618.1 hypothetical protein An08g06485 [Aspergillus niger]
MPALVSRTARRSPTPAMPISSTVSGLTSLRAYEIPSLETSPQFSSCDLLLDLSSSTFRCVANIIHISAVFLRHTYTHTYCRH